MKVLSQFMILSSCLMKGDFILVRLKTGMRKTLKSARRPEVGNSGKVTGI